MRCDNKTSAASSAKESDDDTLHLGLEDIPLFLQNRDLIPKPLGSRFSITPINTKHSKNDGDNNNAEENSKSSPEMKDEEERHEIDEVTNKDKSFNDEVMAIGWRKHAAAVQNDIENLLLLSLQQKSGNSDDVDNDQSIIHSRMKLFLHEAFGSTFTESMIKRSKENSNDENTKHKINDEIHGYGNNGLLNTFTFYDIDALVSKLKECSTPIQGNKTCESDNGKVKSEVTSSVSSLLKKWKTIHEQYHKANTHIAHATRMLIKATNHDLPKLRNESIGLKSKRDAEQKQLNSKLVPCYDGAILKFDQLQLELGVSVVDNISTIAEGKMGEKRWNEFCTSDIVDSIPEDELNRLCRDIEQDVAATVIGGLLLEMMNYYETFVSTVGETIYIDTPRVYHGTDEVAKSKNVLPLLHRTTKKIIDNSGDENEKESFLLSKSTRLDLINELMELKGFLLARLFEVRANHGVESGVSSSSATFALFRASQSTQSLLPSKGKTTSTSCAGADRSTDAFTPNEDNGEKMIIKKLEEYKTIVENLLGKMTSGRFALLTSLKENTKHQSIVASKFSTASYEIYEAQNSIQSSKQIIEMMQQQEGDLEKDVKILESRIEILHKALEQEICFLHIDSNIEKNKRRQKVRINMQ